MIYEMCKPKSSDKLCIYDGSDRCQFFGMNPLKCGTLNKLKLDNQQKRKEEIA